jgi:hypothetical protein
MDAARFAEFTAYGPDVFASFVADFWERAGYDCSLTDARGPNVVARRGDDGVIRIAATVDATSDPETFVDADGTPSVDVVVVPQSTTDTRARCGGVRRRSARRTDRGVRRDGARRRLPPRVRRRPRARPSATARA